MGSSSMRSASVGFRSMLRRSLRTTDGEGSKAYTRTFGQEAITGRHTEPTLAPISQRTHSSAGRRCRRYVTSPCWYPPKYSREKSITSPVSSSYSTPSTVARKSGVSNRRSPRSVCRRSLCLPRNAGAKLDQRASSLRPLLGSVSSTGAWSSLGSPVSIAGSGPGWVAFH